MRPFVGSRSSTASRKSVSEKPMTPWFPNGPGPRGEIVMMEQTPMSCPPGTVAAYLRVSVRLIASQREGVLDHAGRRGWAIPDTRVFADDGFSGATLERPALEARDGVASGDRDGVGVVDRPTEPQLRSSDPVAGRVRPHRCHDRVVQEPDNARPRACCCASLSVISEYSAPKSRSARVGASVLVRAR